MNNNGYVWGKLVVFNWFWIKYEIIWFNFRVFYLKYLFVGWVWMWGGGIGYVTGIFVGFEDGWECFFVINLTCLITFIQVWLHTIKHIMLYWLSLIFFFVSLISFTVYPLNQRMLSIIELFFKFLQSISPSKQELGLQKRVIFFSCCFKFSPDGSLNDFTPSYELPGCTISMIPSQAISELDIFMIKQQNFSFWWRFIRPYQVFHRFFDNLFNNSHYN